MFTPTAAVTALSTTTHPTTSPLEAGMDGYIPKPVRKQELYDALADLK